MRADRRLLAADGLVTFALLGALQALYGPLVPGLKQAFAIDTSAAGLVFTAHGAGALVGILTPTVLRAKRIALHWLAVASGLLVLGAIGMFVAPNWPALLAAAFLLAVGFGIHVERLNSLFVAGFGARGMTMSQLINASFSIGSIVGPLALGLWGAPSPSVFGGVALLALLLLPLSVATDATVRKIGSEPVDPGRHARAPAGSRAVLMAFVAMMCLVVGVENAIAGWTATLALARGYTYAEAANLTALFFGAVLGGRLLAATLARRADAGSLVVIAIAGIAVLLVIAGLTPAGPVALALTGFAIAPIFSATLVWVGTALPTAGHTNAIVIAGALLGSATFPALIGWLIEQLGPAAAPPAIFALTVGALAVASWLYFVRRG